MSAESFIIYRSSAGSGKTYTLTKEYLKLALKSTRYYKYILAVTFTNKAMQEMKNRIIQKLHEFSEGKMDGMAEELMAHANLDETTFQLKCRQILTEILHGYSHFSISTIDTFFQKVIRSFAKELGLAGSYRLELDVDLILIQIVDDLLFEVTENKQIREWIIRFARENLQEGNNWDVRRNIKDLARELFNESFKYIEDEIAGHDHSLVKKLKTSIDEIIAVFENKMHSLGAEGLQQLKGNGLEIEDFSYGRSGAMGHLYKICKDNKSYEPGKRLLSALEGGSWYKKTSKKADLIDMTLASGLEDILRQSVDYYAQQFEVYSTALQIKKFLYGYGLLADLARKLQEYKKANNVMLISDATRFLKELVQDADTPFVYEKVGSFYRHYLIDEFQDTSGFQWESFRPLVDDSLAQGYKNLVVGDIKQSIYRWRGGDWELLLRKIESDIGSNRTTNKVLDTNFRSEANIIQFNNSIFKLLPQVLMNEGGSDQDPDWQVLDQVYEDTYQKIPPHKQENPQGYINITFYKDEEDDKWKDKVSRQLPQVVEELQDKGVPLKEIAVLVRNNKEGKTVADYLSDYEHSAQAKEGYRYDVVSNESLFLVASPAVRLVVSALRYLADAKDKVVQAQLVYDYQKAVKKSAEPVSKLMQSIGKGKFEEWLPTEFFSRKPYLMHLPFYELAEELINIFEVNQLHGQFAYLQTFQDLILKFTQNEKGDVFSFLEWWYEKGSKASIKVADDLDAIRIMTIHKSKGLEYTSVIVPFCDWEIDHQRSPIIWTASDQEPFNIGHLPLKYKKDLAATVYKEDYEEEKIKAHLDNLNVLYVAFTRAAHNLWVMAPDKKKQISKVLRDTLANSSFELYEAWDEEENVFEYGNRDYKFEIEEEHAAPALTLKSYQHFDWRQKIAVKNAAKDFTEADDRRVKINYGILIHNLLASVEVMADQERALETLRYEEGLNKDQIKEISGLLKDLLANPAAKGWFTADWKVYNEMPIILPGAEYRLDRVMIKQNKAIIIDYKTGIPKSEDQRQMTNYKSLLSEMGYEEVQGYLWYLGENRVEEVL
ncbi:UvrD-helicase domain-containing protein [Fulvivirga sediminis]|uniref:DNA 3'-5' helicase n=1 Tax=Fulvivirga sediminis TaxID=2803949 RepID=A0A937FC41_9BACT|nr:UvrD-helicase domain-containing protein [Fulvivirga sediminis]MBL3658069.1 UvrD-helicase domain-containing protein [Fulvivirga sediminis]